MGLNHGGPDGHTVTFEPRNGGRVTVTHWWKIWEKVECGSVRTATTEFARVEWRMLWRAGYRRTKWGILKWEVDNVPPR